MDYFLLTSLTKEISRIDLIGIIVGHIIFGFALTQILDWSWLKKLMSDKDKEKMLQGYNWKDLLVDSAILAVIIGFSFLIISLFL
tara:strand:+ start:88 stop:342 length:255 start_codon:yes stop_codon:yes gene_type:complete